MASLWEQMVTEENRLLAARLGLRISDVEEQLSLLGTLEESKQASDIAIELSVALQDRVVQSAAPKSSSSPTIEAEEEIGSDIDIQEASSKSKNIISTNYLTRASLPEGSGPWPLLPQVLVDYILFFLGDIDMCGYISIASRSTFVLSEDVYRFLCEITYPRQTSKKICRVQHWKSWKNMIIHRPRLRLNGFYSLRTMYSKCYSNDAFWEEKKFESIEVFLMFQPYNVYDSGN